MFKGNIFPFASVVVARDTYVKVGGFLATLSHCADWEMWMRVATEGPVGYIHHPYACYRVHDQSDTRKHMKSAKNIEEAIETIEIGVRRLPPKLQSETRAMAYKHLSIYANWCRGEMHLKDQQHVAGLRQARWAFMLAPSARRFLQLLQSAFRVLRHGLR